MERILWASPSPFVRAARPRRVGRMPAFRGLFARFELSSIQAGSARAQQVLVSWCREHRELLIAASKSGVEVSARLECYADDLVLCTVEIAPEVHTLACSLPIAFRVVFHASSD